MMENSQIIEGMYTVKWYDIDYDMKADINRGGRFIAHSEICSFNFPAKKLSLCNNVLLVTLQD